MDNYPAGSNNSHAPWNRDEAKTKPEWKTYRFDVCIKARGEEEAFETLLDSISSSPNISDLEPIGEIK